MSDEDLTDILGDTKASAEPKTRKVATKKGTAKKAAKKKTAASSGKYEFDLESTDAVAIMKGLAKAIKEPTVIKEFAAKYNIEAFKVMRCAKELQRQKILRVEKDKKTHKLTMDVWKPKRAPKGATDDANGRTVRPKQPVIVITVPGIPAKLIGFIRTALKLKLNIQSITADGVLVMA